MAEKDEALTGLAQARDRAQEIADSLLAATFGPDYQVVMRARRRADYIRVERDGFEAGVDDLIKVFDTERAEAVPLELRVALTVEGFATKIAEDPSLLGKTLTLMGLLVERLAALPTPVRDSARTKALAQVTPAGTFTTKGSGRG